MTQTPDAEAVERERVALALAKEAEPEIVKKLEAYVSSGELANVVVSILDPNDRQWDQQVRRYALQTRARFWVNVTPRESFLRGARSHSSGAAIIESVSRRPPRGHCWLVVFAASGVITMTIEPQREASTRTVVATHVGSA